MNGSGRLLIFGNTNMTPKEHENAMQVMEKSDGKDVMLMFSKATQVKYHDLTKEH